MSEEKDPQRSPRRRPAASAVLDRQYVAELLGFADARATDRWQEKHSDAPRPFYTFSRSPRWRRSDVQAWIDKHAEAALRKGPNEG